MWHHDVTNPRTCQFSAVCLTVFPFEFRPRTFTIGFYGKKSIISELMILECSFPLSLPQIPTIFLCSSASHFFLLSFHIVSFLSHNSLEGEYCSVPPSHTTTLYFPILIFDVHLQLSCTFLFPHALASFSDWHRHKSTQLDSFSLSFASLHFSSWRLYLIFLFSLIKNFVLWRSVFHHVVTTGMSNHSLSTFQTFWRRNFVAGLVPAIFSASKPFLHTA